MCEEMRMTLTRQRIRYYEAWNSYQILFSFINILGFLFNFDLWLELSDSLIKKKSSKFFEFFIIILAAL